MSDVRREMPPEAGAASLLRRVRASFPADKLRPSAILRHSHFFFDAARARLAAPACSSLAEAHLRHGAAHIHGTPPSVGI